MRWIIVAFLYCVVAHSDAFGQEFRSGFELGSIAKPDGWKLADNGMSKVTLGRALTGRRSLQINDVDAKELGSSCLSNSIRARPGDTIRLTLACYLESGDSRGLGAYIEFLGADGKRIGERVGYRQELALGTWNPMVTIAKAPAGTVASRAWLHTISNSVIKCNVDNVRLQKVPPEGTVNVSGWNGAVLDGSKRKEWIAGVRWDHGKTAYVNYDMNDRNDWSKFKTLSFNVYSESNTGSSFVIVFDSDDKSTDGPDYFSYKVDIDFAGWKSFELPLSDLRKSRKPVGWHSIESLKLRAVGYGQILNPKTVVVLDGVKLR